jgi:hypothetical protein
MPVTSSETREQTRERSTAFRVGLAFLASGLAGVAVPCLFVFTAMIVPVRETLGRLAGILLAVPASLICGTIALWLAGTVLRLGYADSARRMAGPFAAAFVVSGLACAAVIPQFRSERLYVQSSPYLATAGYAFLMCTLSSLGATCISALLALRHTRRR